MGDHFRKMETSDRVVFYDSHTMRLQLGSALTGLENEVELKGNPLYGTLLKDYARPESVSEYGSEARRLDLFSIAREADADLLMEGLLDDVAYPEGEGSITFYCGDSEVAVGEVIAFRGEPLRRRSRELPGEWGGRFSGQLVRRVRAVRHRFSGKRAETTAYFTSPLRSVSEPLSFMTRSQEAESSLFAFRLDDATVALDTGFHLN